MIISHRHKFIFFAVPKTGTHSVRQALRSHLGAEDLEQVGLFVQKRFPFPEFKDIPHGHLTVRQIEPVLGAETFRSYFKFAYVRNPYDRFISLCAFRGRGGEFKADPVGFMKSIARGPSPLGHLLYWPQTAFLSGESGELAMDFIGRTETMQGSYDEICDRLGLPKTVLARANSSEHRPYREYYDEELERFVSQFYRADLEKLGYEFNAVAA